MTKRRFDLLSRYFLGILTLSISIALVSGAVSASAAYFFIIIFIVYLICLWFAIGKREILKPKHVVTNSSILIIALLVGLLAFRGNTSGAILTFWPILLVPLLVMAGYIFSLRRRRGSEETNLQGSQYTIENQPLGLTFALLFLIPGLLMTLLIIAYFFFNPF